MAKSNSQKIVSAFQMPSAKKLIRRSYEGAQYSRIWTDWITGNNSANTEIYGVLPTLRNRCRDLARNDPYAGGAIDTICDNVLGECGFKFQSKVPKMGGDGYNEPAIARIESLMRHVCMREHIDVRGISEFAQLSRLVLRTWAESGEVLIRKYRKSFGNCKIPYAIKVLEPDYLAEDLVIKPNRPGSEVIMGIQIDQHGRREGYWCYKQHPGDRLAVKVNRADIEFIPASEMDHLFLCDRPEQLRGVPWLAIAIKRLHFLADTEDAELVAAKLAAFVGGVIKTNNPEAFSDTALPSYYEDSEEESGETNSPEKEEPRFRDFEPGMFLKLFENEDVQTFNSNRPNQALEPFTKHILRGISAGIIGLSYSSLSSDFTDASYSSHRAEKLKEIRAVKRIQYELRTQFHSPQTREIIDTAWLHGVINLPGYELREDIYQAHIWGAPGFDWIDPQKDIQAALTAIEGGLSTYQIELAKQNHDFDEIVAQRAREKKVLQDAGLLPPDEQPQELRDGLGAIRSLLDDQSERMRTILSQLESRPTSEIIKALMDQATQLPATPAQSEPDQSEPDAPFVVRQDLTPLRFPTIIRKVKKCTKGKPCGGSCQAQSGVCWVNLSAEQLKLARQAKRAMQKGEVGPSTEIAPPFDPKPKIHASLHEFYDFAVGAGTLTLDEEKKAAEIIKIEDANKYQKKKIGKLNSDGLTTVEAAAFEGYIGGSYKGINEVQYNAKGFAGTDDINSNFLDFEEQMLVNKAAASGLKKIKKVTLEDIQSLDDAWDESKPLLRYATFDRQVLKSFKAKLQSSIDDNEPFVHEQFLSTTFNQKGLGYFSEGANVEYRITPKVDGSGGGVLVDKYKNAKFESEVLYPPFQQFKVKSVTDLPATKAVYETVEKSVPKTKKAEAQAKVQAILESNLSFDKVIGVQAGKNAAIGEIEVKIFNAKYVKKDKTLVGHLTAFKKEIESLPYKELAKKQKELKAQAEAAGTKKVMQKQLVSPASKGSVIIELEEL